LPLRIASWNINSLRLRLDNVTRIVETLPTLRMLIEQGGKLVLAAHLDGTVITADAPGRRLL
jgi:3-phosphoglycerate kinase